MTLGLLLAPVLHHASAEDLGPLLTLLEDEVRRDGAWSTAQLREAREAELRASGRNSFVNLAPREGPLWSEIVRDVAKKMKVAHGDATTPAALERAVARHILERAIEQMTPEQRAVLRAELECSGLPRDLPLGHGAFALGPLGGNLAGFTAYQVLVIVANARTGRPRPRSDRERHADPPARRRAGPVGWALTALWMAIDVAGPAYCITIPSLVLVAVLSAQQEAA
jgi:uncharacterized protein YaaW (UPF0174 family)